MAIKSAYLITAKDSSPVITYYPVLLRQLLKLPLSSKYCETRLSFIPPHKYIYWPSHYSKIKCQEGQARAGQLMSTHRQAI